MKFKLRFAALWFALLAIVLSVTWLQAKNKNSSQSYVVYVGTYTGPSSEGIYGFRFDRATGQVNSIGLLGKTKNPSFLAADAAGQHLYAVNEVSDFQGKKSGAVTSFSIDRASGKLTELNQVPSGGAGPCYITVDKTGKFVLVANYDSGTVATFPIIADGKLGQASAVVQHSGHGPDAERQEAPHAHEIELSKDNRFAIAADLGLDKLLIYKFDARTGALTPNQPAFAELDPGSGPRHFAFTPDQKFAYVLTEMLSAITAFSYDAEAGSFHKLATISSLPPDYKGRKEAAEIAVSPSGNYVYASNRGSDTIGVFSISQDGKLAPVEYVATQGKTPRGFGMDPSGSYLFVANEESNNVVVFRIDGKSGRLQPTGQILNAPSPVDIKFVKAK